MFFENLEFCEYLGPKPFDTLDYSPLSEPDGEILYLNLIEAVRVMAVTVKTYRYGKKSPRRPKPNHPKFTSLISGIEVVKQIFITLQFEIWNSLFHKILKSSKLSILRLNFKVSGFGWYRTFGLYWLLCGTWWVKVLTDRIRIVHFKY